MKVFVIFTLFVAVSANSAEFEARISNGQNAKFGAVKCYTTLSISFEDTVRTCGGCLIGEKQVLTSGNCVTSLEEGTTTEIKFAFGTSRSIRRGIGFEDIKFPETYDPSVRNSTGDLALITLNTTVSSSLSRQPSKPSTDDKPDSYVGKKLFVCGFGHTDNKKKKPTRLQCTYLKVIPSSECIPAAAETTTAAAATTDAGATTAAAGGDTTAAAGATTAAAGGDTTAAAGGDTTAAAGGDTTAAAGGDTTAAAGGDTTAAAGGDTTAAAGGDTTAAAGGDTTVAPAARMLFDEAAADGGSKIICTRNIDDSNVCRGDEGSPVFIKKGSEMEFVGVVSYFPDVRSNARCQDGHKVVITQVGAYSDFLSE